MPDKKLLSQEIRFGFWDYEMECWRTANDVSVAEITEKLQCSDDLVHTLHVLTGMIGDAIVNDLCDIGRRLDSIEERVGS
jgi:hypothetical protein